MGGPSPKSPVEIIVADGPEGMARAAASVVEREADVAVAARGVFTMALSGGSTPRGLYRLLREEKEAAIPWPSVHLFWGDERCVPPTDDRSNYLAAKSTGLLDLPLAGVHRMPGEADPEEGAAAYARLLAESVPPRTLELGASLSCRTAVPAPPALDLVLLGLGDDGHTASIFPGSPVLDETSRWVVPTGPQGGVRRLTLTRPVLASAGRLLFLVAGKSKEGVVAQIVRDRDPSAPATLVVDEARAVTWVVDEAAAGLLDHR